MAATDQLYDMQDIMGQLPLLKAYTHLLLCFPVPDNGHARGAIVQTFQAATRQLTTSFPWLAGRVINPDTGPGCSGIFAVAPYPSFKTILQVRDLSNVCPSYRDILNARGPSSMLDGGLLAVRNTFPEIYAESEYDPVPVVVFRASFITGGLLLNCAGQHNVFDMTGMAQLSRLPATAISGQNFPNAAIKQGNRDRSALFPLLQPGEARYDHSHMRCPPPWQRKPVLAQPSKAPAWHYFRFIAAKLAYLKAMATGSDGADGTTAPASTDDALSALLWKRVSAIRMREWQTPSVVSRFCRAIGCRRVLGISSEYMGDLVTNAHSTMTFGDLDKAPLSAIAALIRSNVSRVNNERYISSFATLVAEEPDKSTFSYAGNFKPETDIGSLSWACVDLPSVTFSELGKPTFVRRPRFMPVRGLVYFMAKTVDGGVDTLLCFSEVEIQGLRSDSDWDELVDYIVVVKSLWNQFFGNPTHTTSSSNTSSTISLPPQRLTTLCTYIK